MAQYHVTLDGQGLILELAAYRKGPAQAPRLAQTERVSMRPELPGGVLETSYASPESDISVLRAYQGKLYAGSKNRGKVYQFDGTTWSESHDHGASVQGILAMAEWDGALYVANKTNGQVAARRGDGSAWRFPEFTITGTGCNDTDAANAGVGALVGLPGAGGTARGLLYAVGNAVLSTTCAATVRSWDLATLSADLFRLNERQASAAIALDGKVFLFGAEKGGQAYGAIYRGPSWAVHRPALPDAYVLVAAALGEELYLATSSGAVYRLAGQRLDQVGIVPGLADMLAFGGALWCSAYDATQGVHLRRFDGLGWAVAYASGSGAAAGALGLYGNRLYVGSDGNILRTSVALSPSGALKRQWELEALLEGIAELPLLRLDGTPEPLTGAQLTANLWTALAKGKPVAFVDLDGTTYTVWLQGLEERLAPRSQRGGYHRVGQLRLLEA